MKPTVLQRYPRPALASDACMETRLAGSAIAPPYEVRKACRLALPSDLRLVRRLPYVAERSVTGRAVLTEFRQAVANPGTPAPVLSVRDLWRVSVEPGRGQASIRLGDEKTVARHVSNILTMLGLPTGHRLRL